MALFVPAAVRDKRLAICRACPNAKALGRKKFLRCELCLCVLAMKVRMPGEKCPAGKW